ncbi:MAG: hypothetical protein NZZ41_06475 [Candidatus Dojkabacteria bacterium]|nr:hypothetical protein [Candidatus Dojkabacteria bacterium]
MYKIFVHIGQKIFNHIPITLSIIILVTMLFFIQPKNYGDGSEYHIMLQSFVNHLSPEQRENDANKLVEYAQKTGGSTNPNIFIEYKYSGYFPDKYGNLHSYHFWLYSLMVLPVRVIVELIGLNPLISFQVFNSLVLLMFSILLIKLYKHQSLVIWMLSVVNISIWFIYWNHPEYVSYIFVLISMILFSKNYIFWSILLSSTVANQNPPIIFLSIAYFLIFFTRQIFKYKKLAHLIRQSTLPLLALSVGFLSYVFYYIYYDHPNLITKVGASDFSLISIQRIFELLLDPGIGLFVFNPFIVTILFMLPIYSIFKLLKNRYSVSELINSKYFLYIFLFGILILMLAFSSSTLNWNHGTTGPSRYTIWSILPTGIFFLIEIIEKLSITKQVNKKIKKAFTFYVLICILYSISIVLIGFSISRFGHLGFNIFQRILLSHIPQIYNPSPQIFIERAIGMEIDANYDYDKIFIYFIDKQCQKSITSIQHISELEKICNKKPKIDYCFNQKQCYFSFK